MFVLSLLFTIFRYKEINYTTNLIEISIVVNFSITVFIHKMAKPELDMSEIMVGQCGKRIGDYLVKKYGSLNKAAKEMNYASNTLSGAIRNNNLGVSSLLLSKIVLSDPGVDLNYFFTGNKQSNKQMPDNLMSEKPEETSANPLILANSIKELSNVIKDLTEVQRAQLKK